MATIERDGITFAFEDRGHGGPPVLLVHGMACDRATMTPQLDHLGTSHRTVTYDQRGHGESSKPLDAPYDPVSLAEDALWLCRELGLERPVVIGHSLGGTVALALAATYPDATGGIVLLDSVFGLDAEAKDGLRSFYDALTDDTFDGIVRAFVHERLFDDGEEGPEAERVIDLMAGCPPAVFVGMGNGLLGFDIDAATAAVTVPTLYVSSSRPWGDLGDLHRARPDWYLGRTVGAGHFHNLFAASQVNAMIDTFLARVASGHLTAQPSDF